MNANAAALRQYQSVDLRATVETASPHKLIAMLFEGALKAMAKAKGAAERGNTTERTQQLNKASDILVHLRAMLDVEKGGEYAQNLYALYGYMIRRVISANRDNSPEAAQEVIDLLLQVKLGWDEVPVEDR
ncbi:MAG: flagellar export chaperone FliS [Pontibacterium sp.]